MVSLRKREKAALVSYLENRTSKMPILLDPSDYILQIERAVRKLDEVMFNPRSTILENASNGLIDVTALMMDEITTVYYSQDSISSLMGGLDLGVGVMPILTATMMPLSTLESMVDYLIIKSLLNHVQREMLNAWDYTLLPLDSNGRQYLQVRNPGNLFWVEFLPYIDPASDSWDLYENEYSFLVELCFAYLCHANVEIQAQASSLGVGKEAVALTQYWEKRIETIIKDFTDSSLINYLA